jgi:raffinose/stachyose/melibiose transport system permease protein
VIGERTSLKVLKYVVLSIVAIPWLVIPALLVILNSFKTQGEAALLQLTLPTQWHLVENYGAVFTDGHYVDALLHTVVVVVPIVVGVVVLGAMASWAFGRSNGKLTRLGYFGVILSILVPPAIIPTIEMLNVVGLSESQLSYILVMIASRMGLLVFLSTGFVRTMPPDLEEAAAIDGASNLRTFWSLIMPMLRPVLFVGGVILAIIVWGDFLYAQFLLPTTDLQTLQLSLFNFATASAQGDLSWNLVFAHLVMTSAPLIVVYIVAQRQIVGGLSEGALKG